MIVHVFRKEEREYYDIEIMGRRGGLRAIGADGGTTELTMARYRHLALYRQTQCEGL